MGVQSGGTVQTGTEGQLIFNGSGVGLVESGDEGWFLHREVPETLALTIRLASAPSLSGRVGLQLRAGLAPTDARVFAGWNAAGDRMLVWRSVSGGADYSRIIPSGAGDWLRLLVKSGVVVVESSVDAETWAPLAAVNFSVDANTRAGVFFSSGSSSQSGAAVLGDLYREETTPLGVIGITNAASGAGGVTLSGDWSLQSETGTGLVSDDYVSDAGVAKGSGAVALEAGAVFGGWHDLFLLWSPGGDRDDQVPVDVEHLGADGETPTTSSMTVDQLLGGHWAYLGEYFFKPGDPDCRVTVSNDGTVGLVTLDALMIVQRPERMPWKSLLWNENRKFNVSSAAEFGHSGSVLTKTSGGAAWNAGASSRRVLRGDGILEWRHTHNNRRVFVALSADDPGLTWQELDYALFGRHDGLNYLYEIGTTLGSEGSYGPDDVLRIQRMNGEISYFRNDTLLGVSNIPSTGELLVDTAFYENLGEITGARWWGAVLPGDRDEDGLPDGADGIIPFWEENVRDALGLTSLEEVDPQSDPDGDGRGILREYYDYTNPADPGSVFIGRPVDWVGHANTTSDPALLVQDPNYEGTQLRKNAGGDAWNADAVSRRAVVGDGKVVFRADATNKTIMVGFSASDANNSYNSLDRALHLQTGGNLRVYEDGQLDPAAPVDSFAPGDLLSIERDGDWMRYARNGVEFYTKGNAPTGHLIVDTSFLHQGGQLNDTRVSGAFLLGDRDEDGLPDGPEGVPMNWEEQILTFKGWSHIDQVLPGDDADGDGRTNGQEFYEWSDPTDEHDFRLFEDLEWTDTLRMVPSIPLPGGGSHLVKNAGNGAWNAGAVGAVVLPDDGEFRFGFARNNRRIQVGFDAGNENHQPGTIDFRVVGQLDGKVSIYEDGVKVFPASGQPAQPYSADDEFSVERRDGIIRVWMNGKHGDPLYASATINRDWVRVDASAYDTLAELWKCRVDGMFDFETVETGFEVSEGFSPGVLDGQGGFSATSGVEVSSSNPAAGSLGVRLADYGDEFSASYSGHHSPHAEVAMEVYVDSGAEFLDDPSLFPEEVATVVTFDPARGLVAWDGDGEGGGAWATAPGTSGLAGQYVELRVQIDYEKQTWRLLVDDVEKLTGLGLRHAADALSLAGLENRNRRELAADVYRMKGTLTPSPEP